MEKLLEGSTKTIESMKRVVSRNTRLNMQVGKGAVAPKKVYRFPSPASQPNSDAAEIHLAHSWRHQPKYTDKAMEYRDSDFNRQRESHPLSDQRNLFNHSFKNLPPEPIYNVLMFGEAVYDKIDGFKKGIHEVPEENRDWRE